MKRRGAWSDATVHRALVADREAVPTDEAFWRGAVLVMPKRKVTLRLDADLLAWLRRERGYQTRINAVLRMYMQTQLRKWDWRIVVVREVI